ncbi:hypothetical protein AZE42_12632 [Rhizopogon vesiculosus]|uniref:Uncharacterized protein n=1 Tax=Rhizopogon vesiculosus TaxID=180088 RepID=A0A1J8QLT7_9AGAM|nr:hypothetical protein AZE42_12632 [Rhizopogon vesiculosus]
MFVNHGGSAIRLEPDKVLKDVTDYIHNYQNFPDYTKRLDTVVEGTIVPNGAMSFIV